MPSSTYEELLALMREINDLNGASALLGWDQETYLPPKGQPARARQLSTLSGLAHSKFTSTEVGRLLDDLETTQNDAPNETQKTVVRELRYDYDRAAKLPVELVKEIAETTSLSTAAWREAREESDFSKFAPYLRKVIDLSRQKAEAYGYEKSPYDALFEDYERGMTAEKVRPVFETLRSRLTPMIKAIGKSPDKPAQEILARNYDVQKQWDFGMRVLADMGFDLEAGRQDRSAHPFTVGVHPLDVRLTTRLAVNEFAMGLFATMHEGGHGLFEQGYHPDHQDTVLAQAPSLGIHESQSRLWENQVGRSRAFWRHYYPSLQSIFPEALGSTPEVDFYRAINTVRPSLIRVEADEATYALHIVLRFEIECGLIEGSVEVDDLPDLWNAKMKEYLGIEPSNDAEGVLQDVHWSHGLIGYFPTYALGNIYSAQIFDRIRADLGDPGALIERGELAPIREWLRVNIHHAGRTRTADELIKDVCGESLNPEPLLGYMAGKFGAVYEVGL